jgi:hypothetical protein
MGERRRQTESPVEVRPTPTRYIPPELLELAEDCRMGYRDDFYVVDNIIGYTGDLHDNPTVYFETDEEYGHITQDHPHDDNIGRERVDPVEGYVASNNDLGPQKGVRLQEGFGDKVRHTSRNELISIEGMSQGDKDILKMSIWTFPSLKVKYRTRERSNAVSA